MQVSCASPLSVGSFVWLPRAGAFALAVVCKATYTLRPGTSPLAERADEPTFGDVHWQGDPSASVLVPSDRAPFKRRVDVLAGGHVHAPGGRPARSLVARLVAGAVDKAVVVLGDRHWNADGSSSPPSPFTRMPLLWERAQGGPSTWNPVGIPVGLTPGQGTFPPLPSFEPVGFARQSPAHGSMPVGLGPLSPAWSRRSMYLRRHRATWAHETWHLAPLPEDVDAAYFNAAPADQQLERLPEQVPIHLEHLHPEIASLRTTIVDIRPRALVTRLRAAPEEVPMHCDTLFIDADRGTCTLTWRVSVPLSSPQEKGIVFVSAARAPEVDRASAGAVPAEAPVPPGGPPRAEPEWAFEEETTNRAVKVGLIAPHGPMLLRYGPPEVSARAAGRLASEASTRGISGSEGASVALAGVDLEEISFADAGSDDASFEEACLDEASLDEASLDEASLDDEETRTNLPEGARKDVSRAPEAGAGAGEDVPATQRLRPGLAPGPTVVPGGAGPATLRIGPSLAASAPPAPGGPATQRIGPSGAAGPPAGPTTQRIGPSGAAGPRTAPAAHAPRAPRLPPTFGEWPPFPAPPQAASKPRSRPATLPLPKTGDPAAPSPGLPFQPAEGSSATPPPRLGPAQAPSPQPVLPFQVTEASPAAPALPFQPPHVSGSVPAATALPFLPPRASSAPLPGSEQAPSPPRSPPFLVPRGAGEEESAILAIPSPQAPSPLPALPFQAPRASRPPPALPFQRRGTGEQESAILAIPSPQAPSPLPALPFQAPQASSPPRVPPSQPPPAPSPTQGMEGPAAPVLPFQPTHAEGPTRPKTLPLPGSAPSRPALPFPPTSAGGAAPLAEPGPRLAAPAPLPPRLDDEITHSGAAEDIAAPLPFQPAEPATNTPAPPPHNAPATPLFALSSANLPPPNDAPATPLFALSSSSVSPAASDAEDPAALALSDTPVRPRAAGIALEQYARVKIEVWDSDAGLREALERHGIDEIAWRMYERRQADALAAEALEGRCDLALALVAAFEAARAALAEATPDVAAARVPEGG